tara:strand:+ start:1888 stop:2535 length:648 start_codon:yes stop_codon:yes gene_type:complete
MIPVRKGSQRLPKKNYLKINDKSVFEIAAIKAISLNIFDEIFLNTDDPSLQEISNKLGIKFYLRQVHLASSEATSDMVVLDFFKKINCNRMFWLNTVSPLQTKKDILNFFNETILEDSHSSVAVSRHKVHACIENKPINFKWEENFSRTQDLKVLNSFNYSMMSWSRNMMECLENGQLFNEKTRFIETSKWCDFLLKTQEDFDLIKKLSQVAPDQ